MKKAPIPEVEALIDEYRGNVAAIARKLGVNRSTIWNRIKESAILQKKLSDARETMLDNAESALYSNALGGDMTALIFFLKTQGRSRGYSERVELTGADGKPIEVRQTHDVEPGFFADIFVILGAVNATPGTQETDQSAQTAGA